MQWLKQPAWKVGYRGLEPHSGLQAPKKRNVSPPLTRRDSILWFIYGCDREVGCSASHHPQEVLLARFSQYMHKSGLKPHSFNLFRYLVRSLVC